MFYARGSGAQYFNWAGPDFFDPYYHYACTCKTGKDFTTSQTGVTSGPVICSDITTTPGTGDLFKGFCCPMRLNVSLMLHKYYEIEGSKSSSATAVLLKSLNPPIIPPSIAGPDGCCFLLEFTSTGSLASGAQNHILGTWEYDSEGPDGRQTYIQPDNMFNPMYLYWYPALQVKAIKRRLALKDNFSSVDFFHRCGTLAMTKM